MGLIFFGRRAAGGGQRAAGSVLPRLGVKQDRSPVFFPGTQLRHLIREALLMGACKAAGGRLPLKDHFMLIQGEKSGSEKSGSGLSLCTTFVVYEDKKKIFSECKA